jgi:hypothetical protein
LGIEMTGTPLVSQPAGLGAYADMSLLVASIVPCVFKGRIGACAPVSLGRWHGEGRNVQAAREESEFYAAAALRVVGLVPLTGPFTLRLYASAGVTFTRPSFELLGAEVWRAPLIVGEAGAALSLLFL